MPVCMFRHASCIRRADHSLCALQIHLDFAAMQKQDPSLLTLKDFVMSSNQAPNSPDDILSLFQAFAEFKQGADALLPSCVSSASLRHAALSS